MSDNNAATEVPVAYDHLQQLLVPGEEVEATSVQIRLFALTHRRVLIAATNNRFIAIAPGLIGGYQPIDVRWQDLKEAKLEVGPLSATLTVQSSAPTDLAGDGNTGGVHVFSGLDTPTAQAVYRVCQAQEQAWREKRRIRELEELRARSGGIQMGGAPALAGMGDNSQSDPVQRLAQAKEMLVKGLITDSEYESMKARIIASM